MTYTPELGDIFLCDSNRLGAKIIKFLQEAPTIWIWIYRQIRGTQQICRYYHAGMFVSPSYIAEQQGKVQQVKADKIYSRDIIIYRNEKLTPFEKRLLTKRVAEDIGKGFDVVLIIGKTLTWLTGIKWFAVILGKLSKNEEICITRISKWYRGICDFGLENWNLATTKNVDTWCGNHINGWEIVYENK